MASLIACGVRNLWGGGGSLGIGSLFQRSAPAGRGLTTSLPLRDRPLGAGGGVWAALPCFCLSLFLATGISSSTEALCLPYAPESAIGFTASGLNTHRRAPGVASALTLGRRASNQLQARRAYLLADGQSH